MVALKAVVLVSGVAASVSKAAWKFSSKVQVAAATRLNRMCQQQAI